MTEPGKWIVETCIKNSMNPFRWLHKMSEVIPEYNFSTLVE